MKQFIFSIGVILAAFVCQHDLYSQPQFKYGLGGGVNFTKIDNLVSFPIFEDISGAEYSSTYAPLFSNLGSQFFFHGEIELNQFNIALKPGLYSHNFSKTDQILFLTEEYEETSAYLLRYINIPLEAKYIIGNNKFRTFFGGSISYGHLLAQGGQGNHSFIRPKVVAGPVIGAYYDISGIDLVLTAGYDAGLHVVTKKSDRYNTGSSTPYSQSDIKLNQLYITLSVLFSMERNTGSGKGKAGLDCPAIVNKKSKVNSKNYKKRK